MVKAVRIERNKLKPTHVCTGVDLMTMSLTSNRQGAVQISNLLSIIQIHSGPCLYKRRHFMWLNSFTIKNFTPFYHNRWNLFVERIWKNFFFFSRLSCRCHINTPILSCFPSAHCLLEVHTWKYDWLQLYCCVVDIIDVFLVAFGLAKELS